MSTCFGVLMGIVAGCAGQAGGAGDAAQLRLMLVAPFGDRYVLGQPVPLTVVLENAGETAVELRESSIEAVEPNVQMFRGREGEDLVRLPLSGDLVPSVGQETRVLGGRSRRYYTVRVLYHRESANRLAFAEPGRYRIKAGYSRHKGAVPPHDVLESNTITIEVGQPQGADAEVWTKLKRPAFLYFLQTCVVLTNDPEIWAKFGGPGYSAFLQPSDRIPVEAAELVLEQPTGSYAAGLRHALGRYYYFRKHYLTPGKPLDREDLLRDALGLDNELQLGIVFPSLVHPEMDYRLFNQRVRYHYAEETPVQKVLEEATLQTGVPLSVSREILSGRFRSERKDVTLFEFLKAFLYPGWTTWVRDGDGYRLEGIEPEDR